MCNRIELTLSPSVAAGLVATAPWLVASVFVLIAGSAGKHGMFWLAPIPLAGAIVQYRRNGLLAGPSAVLALHQHHNTLYASLGNGQRVEVTPCPASRISASIALLKLRPAASRFRTYPVVLLCSQRFAGNVSGEQFRRLRMWLRLGPPQQSPK